MNVGKERENNNHVVTKTQQELEARAKPEVCLSPFRSHRQALGGDGPCACRRASVLRSSGLHHSRLQLDDVPPRSASTSRQTPIVVSQRLRIRQDASYKVGTCQLIARRERDADDPRRILRAAQGPKPNITGFNMRAFKESAGQPRYDPWERAYD